MEKTIRRKRTVSIQRLAEALAEYAKCDEAKASEALVESLLSRSSAMGPLLLYDTCGMGLPEAVSRERAEGQILELVNSGWWRVADREQVRCDWDRWRMAELHVPGVLSFAAKKLGVPLDVRSAGLLSDLTEKARRGVSDGIDDTLLHGLARGAQVNEMNEAIVKVTPSSREDNLLTAIPATTPGYLDRLHPRYSPKLAAAVRAWLAVENPKGKHPKQALSAWLTRNASDLGLTTKHGKPNKEGIDDCAKVANWKPTGGAPKTPGK